jgi:hypothetical protein
METTNFAKSDVLNWLLDPADPGARYLALRDLTGCQPENADLRAARAAAHRDGPIAAILNELTEDGYWVRPNPGYNPKYRSTDWSVILLAQLGASVHEDARISKAFKYLLDHALTSGGRFTENGAPGGSIDCLQGNLCWALFELGCDDPRLEKAFDYMARSVTGDGIAPLESKDTQERYYAYKCGPLFACGVNDSKACAWGGVKVMLALSVWPEERRTAKMKAAIQAGAEFLLAPGPHTANYPTRTGSKPSRDWWKFGFPVFYITDLLQNVEALQRLGYNEDPRLEDSYRLIRDKQDLSGRWALEFDYPGKTWADFGEKKQPNKWVTIRALRVLKNFQHE